MLANAAGRPFCRSGRGAFSRMGLLAAGCVVALALLAGDAFAAQRPVDLKTADRFAVLGGQTVTNAGFSTLNGDLGVSPGSAFTGFPPGIVIGTKHTADPVAARAQGDLTAAYNDAAGRLPPIALPADVGGRTLPPGVYKSGAALGLTGTLTLDGKGDRNSVFVFQVGSALTTAVKSSVELVNGAQACNVFWQIGSSATLDTSSVFAGNILALTSISMKDGVTLNGRALARNGSVSLIRDTINAPRCGNQPGNQPGKQPGNQPGNQPRRKPISWSIGQYYRSPAKRVLGSVETRPSARALGSALSKLGYDNRTRLKGREPHAVLRDAPAASVIANFNHAAAGIMVTRGRGSKICKTEGLVAGPFTFKCAADRYPILGELSPSALAQTRLVIFGGCHTAETSRFYGNLMLTAKKLGVGSVIGFRGLIYTAARPGPGASRLSGNYFWARFATYIGRGTTIGTAMRRANRDLIKKDGRSWGFSNSVINGASARPASLRLKLTGANAASAGDEPTLLRSRDGDVVVFGAPASTAGPRRLTVAGARSVATRFLARKAPRIAAAGLSVVSERRATHGPGEVLERFTYRSRVAGVPGPAVAEVEVDLRNGNVVGEAAAQRTPSSTRFALGRRGAEAAARRVTVKKRVSVVFARRDVWRYPRWTVKLKAPNGASTVVEINAATGHVMSVNTADPSA